ncbi:sodium-dependent bicarbonate transport family permease, partial [Mycobacterium montefiorense]
MLQEFWQNFTHNLFKPLLLFFYFGFLIPILKVRFEFPYVIYQGLTMYLLLAIGWHGGEELAEVSASSVGAIVGFMVLGFVLNFVIGVIAYFLLGWLTKLRRIDRATIAGYYGSDSAGTFATCVAVLAAVNIAFNAYMPVMLAVMEIPGCLVALYLVAGLRHRGMDAAGNMADEPDYTTVKVGVGVGPGTAARPGHGQSLESERALAVEEELELSLEKGGRTEELDVSPAAKTAKKPSIFSRELFQEVFLN